MAEPKTRPTTESVTAFIEKNTVGKKKQDAYTLLKMMEKITKEKPVMWGTSIIGFGSYKLKYADGKEFDWPLIGFSSRKQNFVFYIMAGFEKKDELLSKLGKYKTGKSCLYINKLEDVDLKVLESIIKEEYICMKKKYK